MGSPHFFMNQSRVATGGCRGMPSIWPHHANPCHMATQRQVTTGFATGLHDYHDSETPWIRLRDWIYWIYCDLCRPPFKGSVKVEGEVLQSVNFLGIQNLTHPSIFHIYHHLSFIHYLILSDYDSLEFSLGKGSEQTATARQQPGNSHQIAAWHRFSFLYLTSCFGIAE